MQPLKSELFICELNIEVFCHFFIIFEFCEIISGFVFIYMNSCHKGSLLTQT